MHAQYPLALARISHDGHRGREIQVLEDLLRAIRSGLGQSEQLTQESNRTVSHHTVSRRRRHSEVAVSRSASVDNLRERDVGIEVVHNHNDLLYTKLPRSMHRILT